MGNYGTFLGKAIDMLRLPLKKTFGNKEREIRILMPGLLKHCIK